MLLADLCRVPLPENKDLTEEVIIEPGSVGHLPGLVRRFLGDTVLWVADPDTWRAYRVAAGDISQFSEPEHLYILPEHAKADTGTVAALNTASRRMTGLVAVGSGTVNDLVKAAASQRGLPYIAVATAASMNGYASGIAALLDRGLKTTVAAQPPRAIIMDTNILRSAPAAMTQAGLGDFISINVSLVDWWLSDQLVGSGFDPMPGQLMGKSLLEVTANAADLKTGETRALTALANGLVLGGVAMVAAATSSPASGGEHLVSHLWDMEALVAGRELNLHGTQVGVATCISAALYQNLLALEHPAFTEPPSWDVEEERIRLDHGALASVVLDQARSKHRNAANRVIELRKRWPEIRDTLKTCGLFRPDRIRAILSEAGAVHSLKTLGVSRLQASRTLRIARDIRDRVTVLDLAYELGFFPKGIDKVLDDSGV